MTRIPRWLQGFVYWLYSLWWEVDFLNPLRLPGVLRAIRMARIARERPRTPRLLVLIRDHPNARDAKLSYALRGLGWTVILLHRSTPSFKCDKYFDRLVQYGDSWDALEKASAFSPVAYHLACTWNFRTAARLIRFRPGKMVFDNNDQLAGHVRSSYLSGQYSGQLRLERYCLERAHGIRCRDMSSQLARKALGYRIRGKRILFLDYGWGMRDPRTEEPPREPLSVSFAGVLALEKLNPEKKYMLYLDIFKRFSRAGIPVHIFPGVSVAQGRAAEDFSEYREWAARCGQFRLHEPVLPEELSREMSRYEFGVYFWGNELNLRNDDPMNLMRRKHREIGSRFLDYVEAGLIVLTHDGRFPSWLVRRYGIGVVVDGGLLDNPREWLDRNRVPAPSSIVRDQWTMPRQIRRLEKFYESL